MKIRHQKVKDALQELIEGGGGYREFDFFDIYKIEDNPRSLYNREDEEGFELRAANAVGTFDMVINKPVPAGFALHAYDFIPIVQAERPLVAPVQDLTDAHVVLSSTLTSDYIGYRSGVGKVIHLIQLFNHDFLPFVAFTNYAHVTITHEALRNQTIDFLARYLVYKAAEVAAATIVDSVFFISTPTNYNFFSPLSAPTPNYLDIVRALYLYGTNVRNDYSKYFLLFCKTIDYYRILTEKDARQNRDLPYEDFIKIIVAPNRYSYYMPNGIGLFAVDSSLILSVSKPRLLLRPGEDNVYYVTFEFYSELRRTETYKSNFDYANVINFNFNTMLSNLA